MNYITFANDFKTQEAILMVKRSKFISRAFYISSQKHAMDLVQDFKKIFHDAKHICYAYVLLKNKKVFDAGEPSGTAGTSILKIIEQEKLSHTIILVARYFGGILLGTGCLSRTYAQAAKLSLINAKIITYEIYFGAMILFACENLNQVTRFLITHNCFIYEIDYRGDLIKINLYASKKFCSELLDLSHAKKFGVREIFIDTHKEIIGYHDIRRKEFRLITGEICDSRL